MNAMTDMNAMNAMVEIRYTYMCGLIYQGKGFLYTTSRVFPRSTFWYWNSERAYASVRVKDTSYIASAPQKGGRAESQKAAQPPSVPGDYPGHPRRRGAQYARVGTHKHRSVQAGARHAHSTAKASNSKECRLWATRRDTPTTCKPRKTHETQTANNLSRHVPYGLRAASRSCGTSGRRLAVDTCRKFRTDTRPA